MTTAYPTRRSARAHFLPVRGLRYHVHAWDDLTT
jgi:hypothetical protein